MESTLKIVSIWIRVICFGPAIFLIGSRRRFEKLLHAGNWEPICAKEKESEKEDGGDRVIIDNA